MTSELDIYLRGKPLAEAHDYFGPARLRDAYCDAKAQVNNEIPKMADKWKQPDVNVFLAAVGLVSEAITRFRRPDTEILPEIRDKILEQLRSQRLVAYGFPYSRKNGALPEKVPIDLFEPDFMMWGKSEIVGTGLHICSVRILRASDEHKLLDQRGSDSTAGAGNRRPGRPSERQRIMKAIGELKNSGTDFSHLSIKEAGNLVRKEIFGEECPDGIIPQGFGNETIRRLINGSSK